LREQHHNKRLSMAATKQQKREQLRREAEKKRLAQKQELDAKLKSAKLRHEKKMKEKARRAKEYDAKIKSAAKEKGHEMMKSDSGWRRNSEWRMLRSDINGRLRTKNNWRISRMQRWRCI